MVRMRAAGKAAAPRNNLLSALTAERTGGKQQTSSRRQKLNDRSIQNFRGASIEVTDSDFGSQRLL